LLEDLRTGNKHVGVKQTLKAVENDRAKVVYLARDAEERVIAKLRDLCIQKSVEIIYVDTMAKLGKACGVEVGSAAACLLK
jgi:large subunit ribosomal protein L7A